MKGGYQILDLTGATAGSPVEVKGIYKAAAGNNGKPVLILTNDGQRVYAEIAEDDGDYITCYISAEGKTINITIKSDDSVTTVVSDPGASITGLEQAVNEIAGNIGDVDDLTTTSKVVVGAVNEVREGVYTKIAEAVSDGTKTIKDILNDIYSQAASYISSGNDTYLLFLWIGYTKCSYATYGYNTFVSINRGIIYTFYPRNGNSTAFTDDTINNTATEISDTLMGDGEKARLYALKLT